MRFLPCFIITFLLFQYSNVHAQNCLTSTTLSSPATITQVIYDNDQCLTITSNGSISTPGYAIDNNAKQRTSIINEGDLVSGTAIYNPGGSISDLINEGNITGGNYSHGIDNIVFSSISNLTNSGIISTGTNSIGILNYDHSTISSLNNTGTITLLDGAGITNWDNSLINTLINSGSILAGDFGTGIANQTNSTINLLNNSGIISTGFGGYSIGNYDSSTISTLTNSGTIFSDDFGIYNVGTINTITNTGAITASANGGNNLSAAIGNEGVINTIDNDGDIVGDGIYGIVNYTGATTHEIINREGATVSGSYAAIENYDLDSLIDSISNSGSIVSNAGNAILNYGTLTTLTNNVSGVISGSGGAWGVVNAFSMGSLINNGTIQVTGAGSTAIYNYNYWANNPLPVIDNITNNGTIFSDDFGIYNEGTINTITNTGAINSIHQSAIWNDVGSITRLNNSQGAGSASGPLTLYGNLPTFYNIIINSPTHYGQLSLTTPSGSTTFGVYSSSVITSRLYTGVLQGLTDLYVGPTRTGSYDGMTWTLALQNGSSTVWDLSFTGASTTYTQLSLNKLASQLRGAFSGQTLATNFANMNTYDCNLFDSKGLCISVGGQQTYVDSPSSNMTSSVVVAGYKVSPTLRIGGFLNQNINSHTGSNVDLSNNTPLMGLFAVWNQNENHLGYQVKIANAYQDMDVTTTRDVIGTSEAGKGKTDLNTQSYVGEVSYAFLANDDKTLVRSYAAIRYTRIKQDSYSERTTSAVTAPLTYAALSDRSTVALMGIKLNHKINDKMNLTGSLGVEQDLNHDVDNLTASGVSGLTSENFNNNINRTRPVASVGAYYMPVKNQRIAADIYCHELPFQSTASTTAYVNYMVGF